MFELIWLTLALTYASSVSSAAEEGIRQVFGRGELAAINTTGAVLIGTGAGAMPSVR